MTPRQLREFASRFPGRDIKHLAALLTLLPTVQRIRAAGRPEN